MLKELAGISTPKQNTYSEFICDTPDEVWKVGHCSSGLPAICVNCRNPCTQTDQKHTINCVEGGREDAVHILEVNFSPVTPGGPSPEELVIKQPSVESRGDNVNKNSHITVDTYTRHESTSKSLVDSEFNSSSGLIGFGVDVLVAFIVIISVAVVLIVVSYRRMFGDIATANHEDGIKSSQFRMIVVGHESVGKVIVVEMNTLFN
jgi:hypothetical protein